MKDFTNIHFMGIGGSGASAIAAIANAQGYHVTGCDRKPFNEFTKVFKQDCLFEGHSPNHLKNIDLLVKTPAIQADELTGAELKAAKQNKIPILAWQEFMGRYLQKSKIVVAVCGTHGKSTTTAMAGMLLEDEGLDPTVELGAIVPRWGQNHRAGQSRYFVTEADEYHNNFKPTIPDITILTSIEMDHPGFFKNINDVKKTFFQFISKTKTAIIANMSDPNIAELIGKLDKNTKVKIIDYSKNQINFAITVPGDYNRMNASAVYNLGLMLRIDPRVIRKCLAAFPGIVRRFEFLGEFKGAKIYSDFGHHPTAIDVTMRAARERFKDKRLILIYQPHLFSRTKVLFKDFVKVFKELPVDKIILTDIYASRENDTGLISSKKLAEAIGKADYYSKDSLEQILDKEIHRGDIVFFMGAGDIDKFARTLVH